MASEALTLGGTVPEGVKATAKDSDIALTGVRRVSETHIRVRPIASPFGEMIGNDHEVRWLHRPEGFVVVKGTVLSELGRSARMPARSRDRWSAR